MKAKEAAITNFINRKVTSLKCDACEGGSWTYDDTLFELREFHGGNMVIGGGAATVPLMTLTCTSCGHVKLFNALVAGLIDKQGNALDG